MILIIVVVGAIVALLAYAFGTPGGRSRYERMEHSAGPAWTDPQMRKGRARLQKLARRNAKKLTRAIHG